MSYCRFSSDNWKSDVYCYESMNGNWVIYVAANRYKDIDNIPKLPPIRKDNHEDWIEKYKLQKEWISKAEREPIGGPYDGDSFSCPSVSECLSTMLRLQAHGYHVPEKTIEVLKEEYNAALA